MRTKIMKIKKTAVLMSAEEYENIQETIEILSDSELVKSISSALKEPSDKRKTHKDIFSPQTKRNGRSKIQ